eukprot:gene24074-9650_t
MYENELSRQKVIAHVDLDAFYCQVESRFNPKLKGKPLVVCQYSPSQYHIGAGGGKDAAVPEAMKAEDPRRLLSSSNSGAIAVSYEARALGVKRGMTGTEARKICPQLLIVQVPTAYGKADLNIYRAAGNQVANILAKLSISDALRRLQKIEEADGPQHLPPEPEEGFAGIHVIGAGSEGRQCPQVQEGSDSQESADDMYARAEGSDSQESADDMYARAEGSDSQESADAHSLQRTRQMNWLGADGAGARGDWNKHEKLLACAATIVSELREAVRHELGFTCSAGVAHYKLLAKLGSGLNKPNQQTVVPACAVAGLLQDLPISKLRSLGGKFGEQICSNLGITTVGELASLPVHKLDGVAGENASWLSRLAHGIDAEEVTPRMLGKSISCGKQFKPGWRINSMFLTSSNFMDVNKASSITRFFKPMGDTAKSSSGQAYDLSAPDNWPAGPRPVQHVGPPKHMSDDLSASDNWPAGPRPVQHVGPPKHMSDDLSAPDNWPAGPRPVQHVGPPKHMSDDLSAPDYWPAGPCPMLRVGPTTRMPVDFSGADEDIDSATLAELPLELQRTEDATLALTFGLLEVLRPIGLENVDSATLAELPLELQLEIRQTVGSAGVSRSKAGKLPSISKGAGLKANERSGGSTKGSKHSGDIKRFFSAK